VAYLAIALSPCCKLLSIRRSGMRCYDRAPQDLPVQSKPAMLHLEVGRWRYRNRHKECSSEKLRIVICLLLAPRHLCRRKSEHEVLSYPSTHPATYLLCNFVQTACSSCPGP
jgi:hypothetical protein